MIVMPEPCINVEESTDENFLHLAQEVGEVMKAYIIYKRNIESDDVDKSYDLYQHLCEELTDVITCANTCLCKIGCKYDERQIIQKKVNDKNERRGYF